MKHMQHSAKKLALKTL